LEEELKSNKEVNYDQYDIREWLSEFDMVNQNPEDNSDFDTDSEINPEKYMNTEIVMEHTGVSSENYLKNRKINLSIIGRPNSGKSSLVNNFLDQEKVLASDVSHTTTDTTSHMFNHKGVKL
jgi:tRNA U34 5-carboxymethylaminomethyl modifying GTPase MnmE/TrmE